MKHLRLFVVLFVVAFMFCATPVFADSSTGSMSLEGRYDSDTIVLTATKEFSLHSYGTYEDEFFNAFVELSGSPSYTITRSPTTLYSYYYDVSVDYKYIVSDSSGSTYFDSLKTFDYVTGPYFTVTCVATFTVSTNSQTPADYASMFDVTLNFSPYCSLVSASNSLDYENNVALGEINQELDGVKDELVEANGTLDNIEGELNDANGTLDNIEGELNDANDTLDDMNSELVESNEKLDEVNAKLDELMKRNTLGNGYDILSFSSDVSLSYFHNSVTGVSNLSDYNASSLISLHGDSYGSVYNELVFYTTSWQTNYGAVPLGYQAPGDYLFLWGIVSESPIDFSSAVYNIFPFMGSNCDYVSTFNGYFTYSYDNTYYYYLVYIPFTFEMYFDAVSVIIVPNTTFAPVSGSFILAKNNGTVSDLMNYLDDKWENGYTIDSAVTDANQSADDSIEGVSNSQQLYFSQYDTAYENAGVSNFKLSVLGNEFAFVQRIVENIWNNMPSRLQFLFYSVLVLGVFGLIISSAGRIAKHYDRSGGKSGK